MKKKLVGLMVAGVSLFVLSGCSGGGGDTVIIDNSPIPETYFITDDFGDGVSEIIYHCDSGFSGVTNFEGAFTFDIEGDNCNFDLLTNNIQEFIYIEYDNDPFTDAGINGIEYECVENGQISETGTTDSNGPSGYSGFITDGANHDGCTLFDVY